MSDWEDAPDDGGWEDAPAAAAKPAELPPPTTKDRILAAEGGVNRGIAGTLGLPADTVANIINLAIAGYETSPGREATRKAVGMQPTEPISKPFLGSEHIAELMERAGITTTMPRPDDKTSRMLHTAGMIGGASVFPGAGVRGVASAAAGGAAASEAFGPEWTGVGAMAPGAMLAGARASSAARSERASRNVEPFLSAGAKASAGQATGAAFMQGIENLIAKFPGGSGVMRKFIERQQADIGVSAKTGVTAEDAGRAIETGVKRSGGFLDRTKEAWIKLDKKVSDAIPAAAGIKPSNTLSTLERLTTPTPGAEDVSGELSTMRLARIRRSFERDMAGKPPQEVIKILGANGETIRSIPIGGTPGKETMPYSALRELRTKVGSLLEDSLVADVPKGELKQLYGALTKDMQAAAEAAGAGKEFARQNRYYKARMDRIEGTLDKIIGKDRVAEDIFKAMEPTNPDQASKVRAVLRSLEPSERQVVTEAIVNRLGRSTPGRQNEVGDRFSTETFLTNYSKLSAGARAQLFPDERMREGVRVIAKAAESIREGGKVFANPSGTAGSFAAYEVYKAPVAAAALIGIGDVFGATAALMTAAGSVATAYGGAKLLTSPRFVEWLAKAPKVKPNNGAAHLARLAVIYNESDEATKRELDAFMSAMTKEGEQR